MNFRVNFSWNLVCHNYVLLGKLLSFTKIQFTCKTGTLVTVFQD